MGWLPIALALAGFVFFVVLVNHNSIKTHEEAIMLAFFNFCQTAKARHTLLVNLQEQLPKNWSSSFPERDFHLSRYPEYHQLVLKEVQSIEETNFLLKTKNNISEEHAKTLKSLLVLNQRQHIYIHVFNRKVREYNTLISSYPTAMVARLTRHRPLKA